MNEYSECTIKTLKGFGFSYEAVKKFYEWVYNTCNNPLLPKRLLPVATTLRDELDNWLQKQPESALNLNRIPEIEGVEYSDEY